MDALLIIITGSLVAASSSLLGSYLVLRKMTMISDAISHAVLPGIVLAFMISGGTNSFAMLLGAGILGIFTTFLIEFFHKKGKLQTDASIGVTFTWLFAIGVIMVSYFAGDAHIDQDCVLYGEIAYVPLDTVVTQSGYNLGPKAILILSGVFVIVVLFILLFYKELLITTFDPAFSQANGFSTHVWHYSLMSLVSLTTVASFESVGAILVVAFLSVPAATAYLITHQFKLMLILSVVFGISASITGYFLAVLLDGSIAGAMATMTGVQFGIVFLLLQLSKKMNRKINIHFEPTFSHGK